MKPNHTKDQRRRLLLLARLLDRVPRKHFDMRYWVLESEQYVGVCPYSVSRLARRECGFAGCAIGWALTNKKVRDMHTKPHELLVDLGFGPNASEVMRPLTPADRLFNSSRKVTPKRVAADIRRYLKDGTLPKE